MEREMEQTQRDMDEYSISFYKIMFPLPIISRQLRIPPEFVKHINKRVFVKATFKDCSGRSWPVKLYKNNKGVFVKDGWDRFFEAHSLGHFEFLTFTYDGETCFHVEIFGKDGVNKLQDDASNGPISFEYCSEDENKSERNEVYEDPTCTEVVPVDVRRKRGRPRKNPLPSSEPALSPHGKKDENKSEHDEVYEVPACTVVVPVEVRRKRGRPRKNPLPSSKPALSPHGKSQDVPHGRSSELKHLGVTNNSKKNMKEVQIIEDKEIAFRFKNIENEKAYQSQDVPHHRSSELKQVQVTKSSRNTIKEVQIIEFPDDEISFRLKDFENEKVYQSNKDRNTIVKASAKNPDTGKRNRGRPIGSKNKKKGQGLRSDEAEYSKKPEEGKGLNTESKKEIIHLCDEDLVLGPRNSSISKELTKKRTPSGPSFRSLRYV